MSSSLDSPKSDTHDLTSNSELHHVAAPNNGNHATPHSFEFCVNSEEGLNLVVDLNSTPLDFYRENSFVPGGAQLTLNSVSDTHQVSTANEPVEEVAMKEKDIDCGDRFLISYDQPPATVANSDVGVADHPLDKNFDHTSSVPSSINSIHASVLLYNYYHRKLSPQLAFADAKQFFMCESLSIGKGLLTLLSMIHECENNSGEDVKLSLTDRAAMCACEVADALDASKDYLNMSTWPISKVAVLLFNRTRKQCLIGYNSTTKAVWSIIETEFDASAGNSHCSNQSADHESMNKGTIGALNVAYMLQQLAFTEVERRTGMKRSNLCLIDEDLTYSLSTKRTMTKLFIVEYDEQTMKSNLVEKPLEELISSMTGPVFVNDPFPKTSTVVQYYHILPYKQILLRLLHRKWPSDPALNSITDESLEEQDANTKSKMHKRTAKVSASKRKKQVTEAIAISNNNSTAKHRKTGKRKSKASMTTAPAKMEGWNGESPERENYSLTVVDVKTSELVSKSRNPKETAAANGENIVLQASVQMDEKETQQSICGDIPQDVFATKAPSVDLLMMNGALEGQNTGVSKKSGGIAENKNGQMYDSLQSIQKIRDDVVRKQHILEECSAQCDMDIQTILSEGEMTPTVISIIDKYKNTNSDMIEVDNSYCSGDGGQTLNTTRLRLRDANLLGNKCQELDDICRGCNWILPRYTILPSLADGMFDARVRLIGPDFDISTNGCRHMTPHKARCSAAASMIFELQKKAEEDKEQDIPDKELPN